MEPSDLNPSANTSSDTRLEALLRRATPELPDNGFSAGVLAALPATTPRTSSRRFGFCLVGAVVGTAFALAQGLSVTDLHSGTERVRTALVSLVATAGDPMFGAAIGATVLSLFVVFRAELRDKLLS